MSILHRLHKLVNGVGGAGNAVLGGIKDIVTAPWTDDEYDGLVETLWGVTKNRMAQGMGSVFGPEGVGGSVIGALPAGVRNPARSVVNPVLGGLETAYREGVAEPISAAVTASSLASAPGGGGIPGLFDPAKWREGYRLAQNRSPGQAIYLALGTKDITDEAEVTKSMNSDGYKLASGVLDAAFRFTVDPAVVAGHAVKGIREGRALLETPGAVAKYANSTDLAKFNDELGKVVAEHGENASSVIRDRWFSDKDKYASSGAVISHVLASTADSGERMQALRALIGDPEALNQLRTKRITIANKIERLSKPPLGISVWPRGAVKAELDTLYPEEARLARLEESTEIPKIVQRVDPNEGRLRTSITRSTFWQQNALAKPLRTITEKVPARLVALHDGSGDIQVKRYLERSALPVEAQDGWRARYMAATNEGERALILTQIEDDAVRSLAEAHGLTTSDVKILMEGAQPDRAAVKGVLSKSRAYDAKGRSRISFEGDDGVMHEVHLPMWATQQVNFHGLVDLEDVRSAVGFLGDWKLRHATLANAPAEMMQSFYRAWKPAQLLRFGWPIRVVGDEQLRILAKIGAVAHLNSLRTGLRGDVADTLKMFGQRQADRLPNFLRRPPERPIRPTVRGNFTTAEGYEMESAFGAKGDMQNVYRQKVSSNASWTALVGAEEDRMLGGLRQASRNWGTILPESADHGPAWEWAVNQQIGQDPMGRQLLRGKSVDEVLKWMLDTADGQKYVASMPARAKNLRAWVENNAEQVYDYVPTEDLRKLALKRTATASDLAEAFPNAAERPAVHGEILMQTQGKGLVSRTIDKTVKTLYTALGKTPTDILSRNRFFDSVYRAESQRLVRLMDPAGPRGEFQLTKVVDAEDKPLRVLHGTGATFDEFASTETGDPGHYFTSDPNTSNSFAGQSSLGGGGYPWQDVTDDQIRRFPRSREADDYITHVLDNIPSEEDRRVMQLRLFKTPDGKGGFEVKLRPLPSGVAPQTRMAYLDIRNPFDATTANGGRGIGGAFKPEFIEELKAKGYDGIFFNESRKSTAPSYVAFSPGQIHDFPDTLPTRINGPLAPETLAKISERARDYALDQTKTLLYDLAEKSRLAEMLRFVMPFYGAWEEVLTVWSGLAVENPAFIRRMHLLWQAPEKAGIVTDENGRPVEWGKKYAAGERGTQRYLTVPVPEWVKDIPGMKGLGSQGSVAFNRQSFNLALNGMPGFGPVVQIPVNEIVKDRPDLEESLKFILPYGSQNTRDLILPTWGRRAFQSAAGEEDRVFHNSVMRIYFDKMVDYNLGKRSDQPTYAEALKEAKALSNLRIFSAFTLPAQPTFRSPYQPYVDAFRQARERYNADPASLADTDGTKRSPEEWFLDTYGAEFFPLTESLSKSVDGIPPTVESWKARKEHLALIQKHPEYGGLIVGADGAGKFSNAVYASQFGERVGPGSTDTQRTAKSWQEAEAGPDVRLGWIEYGRAMDLIDAARVQRGLTSLNVKGASDLLALKQAITTKLAQQHPSWYDDFQTTDEGKWRKRIDAFADIVADPQISQRPEMQGLKQYLDARKTMLAVLSSRPSQTLSAKSNADLSRFWDAVVGSLVERNLAFADLYHRWLSNDPVAMTIQDKAKAA